MAATSINEDCSGHGELAGCPGGERLDPDAAAALHLHEGGGGGQSGVQVTPTQK